MVCDKFNRYPFSQGRDSAGVSPRDAAVRHGVGKGRVVGAGARRARARHGALALQLAHGRRRLLAAGAAQRIPRD